MSSTMSYQKLVDESKDIEMASYGTSSPIPEVSNQNEFIVTNSRTPFTMRRRNQQGELLRIVDRNGAMNQSNGKIFVKKRVRQQDL
jgi:hypothetical protein